MKNLVRNVSLILLVILTLSLIPKTVYASSDFDELSSVLTESNSATNISSKNTNTNTNANTNKNTNKNANVNTNNNKDENLPATGINDHPIAIFVVAILAVFVYALIRIIYYKKLLS